MDDALRRAKHNRPKSARRPFASWPHQLSSTSGHNNPTYCYSSPPSSCHCLILVYWKPAELSVACSHRKHVFHGKVVLTRMSLAAGQDPCGDEVADIYQHVDDLEHEHEEGVGTPIGGSMVCGKSGSWLKQTIGRGTHVWVDVLLGRSFRRISAFVVSDGVWTGRGSDDVSKSI
jgi:hypothetical protein